MTNLQAQYKSYAATMSNDGMTPLTFKEWVKLSDPEPAQLWD